LSNILPSSIPQDFSNRFASVTDDLPKYDDLESLVAKTIIDPVTGSIIDVQY
jgi:hypothetical protein